MRAPRITAELFVIPSNGSCLVYAPLRQAALVASEAVVDQIRALEAGCARKADPALVDLLRRLEIVDAGQETRPVTTFSGPPKPTLVTLFLTTDCNLRCACCYASAGAGPVRNMPLDIARRGIDFVLANALKLGHPEIQIAYHGGGEPALNWGTLTGSFHYARQAARAAGLRVRAALASNGVLPEAKTRWIIGNLETATVSFDGLPQVHDAQRLTAAGQPSSAAVIRTMRRFDEAGFRYGLRLTVTREHLREMEASVRYICDNFRPVSIQFEPAWPLGRWHGEASPDAAAFVSGFRAARAAARKHGVEICFSGARLGLLSNHFCGVTQDSFCLSPDGNVSACYQVFSEDDRWAARFFYGRFDQKHEVFRFDMPVLKRLRSQTVENRAHCRDCFAKWSCGGDCYLQTLALSGQGEFAGGERCHIIRELTRDQILDRIAAAGGSFWHEPPDGQQGEAWRPWLHGWNWLVLRRGGVAGGAHRRVS